MTLDAPRRLHALLFEEEQAAAHFTDLARIKGMVAFEVALAAAQARVGLLPERCAALIARAAEAEAWDLDALAVATGDAGTPALPVIRELVRRVDATDREAAGYVHWGATSQDVLDTALALQLRSARPHLIAWAERCGEAAAGHARAHATSVMSGRTWLQQASPTTFGLKAASWLDGLSRSLERVEAAFDRACVLQLGGATGTRESLGERADVVAAAMAEQLGLGVPQLPWHATRDRVADLGCALAVLVGTLGKIARDVSLLAQTEVEEVREGGCTRRGGSSAMPHKRNPLSCASILALATRTPGLASTLLSAMPQEHERGLGGWQAEWDVLPELVVASAGALQHAAVLLEGLEVDARRMLQNLERSRGEWASEAVGMRLAERIGRPAAHRLVQAVCVDARSQGVPLDQALLATSEGRGLLDRAELARLLEPGRAPLHAEVHVDRVIAYWRARKERDG